MNKRKYKLNCDLGEGLDNDAALMPFLQQANIACGGHAGDLETMRTTLRLCALYGVEAGAHPSFEDRVHFGRVEQSLTESELYALVQEQLGEFLSIANEMMVPVYHVKPHGALYNLSARHAPTAKVIAAAVRDTDPRLTLLGLSGSVSILEAGKAGLRTEHEVFADRSYQADGSLTPRQQPGALMATVEEAVEQVRGLTEEGWVNTMQGTRLHLRADTVCLHGDGPLALAIARALHQSGS